MLKSHTKKSLYLVIKQLKSSATRYTLLNSDLHFKKIPPKKFRQALLKTFCFLVLLFSNSIRKKRKLHFYLSWWKIAHFLIAFFEHLCGMENFVSHSLLQRLRVAPHEGGLLYEPKHTRFSLLIARTGLSNSVWCVCACSFLSTGSGFGSDFRLRSFDRFQSHVGFLTKCMWLSPTMGNCFSRRRDSSRDSFVRDPFM